MTKTPAIDQPVRNRVGDNVRRLRGDRTQATIAELVGVTPPTISKVETGRYDSLDLRMLVRFALGLGCNLDDLLDGCDMAMSIIRYQQAAAA